MKFNERSNELEELKDQFALWLLLSKLKRCEYTTQRLKLQKLVYLIDIFGTIFEKKPTNYTFNVYKLGPFSKDILQDMDRLVSVGIIDAKEIKLWDPNHERSFEYKIKREPELSKIAPAIKRDFSLLERTIVFTVQAVGNFNSEEIRKLVYNEPNYVQAKKQGFMTTINPHYELAKQFRESSRKIAFDQFKMVLDEEQISLLYLGYMKSGKFPHLQ